MTTTAPAFRIVIEEKDISRPVSDRLMSITLRECRGDEADQLDIELDDADGKLKIPSKGAKLNFALGWMGSPLVDKGTFVVSEVEHSGAPDRLTIRARSASMIDAFRQQRDRSFHETTLGAVVDAIAAGNGLASGISHGLRGIAIKHLDQTHESDSALLRRLGKKYDAVATVKSDTLLFMPINESRTASGKSLPLVKVVRALGDQHRYHSSESDAYSGVRAFWMDEKYGLRRSVVAGQAGNSKRLRTTFANEADARTAAVAEWQRIERGLATFEMQLALGDASIMPQSPVVVSGFKADIDATEWLSKTVTHSITGSGFTTRIEFETKSEAADTEREVDHDPEEGITGVKAEWHDRAKKKNNKGTELAGKSDNAKTLKRTYATRQSATRAAALEWAKIKEIREIIRENSTE
ncbi:bacteriophage-related tail D protein [Herbaspirillum sp. GW103]|uniref:contractile injection system protein, VgrG/Pvc8 family n=1 Tax=Herbaspirillum sp. GW103 TaxID=1175306 RepID=UPI00025E273C|nr:contractile injection system protein, VgrG/Pvc8 family [Herbaspirillum sp. GW103]EIJ46452.1 bacteriophage-related tail D protein [Herbaspirillum sp. GW103]